MNGKEKLIENIKTKTVEQLAKNFGESSACPKYYGLPNVSDKVCMFPNKYKCERCWTKALGGNDG